MREHNIENTNLPPRPNLYTVSGRKKKKKEKQSFNLLNVKARNHVIMFVILK